MSGWQIGIDLSINLNWSLRHECFTYLRSLRQCASLELLNRATKWKFDKLLGSFKLTKMANIPIHFIHVKIWMNLTVFPTQYAFEIPSYSGFILLHPSNFSLQVYNKGELIYMNPLTLGSLDSVALQLHMGLWVVAFYLVGWRTKTQSKIIGYHSIC